MKKSGKKGFVLAETIGISVAVITILLLVFIQFSSVDNSYYRSLKYNNVNDLYLVNQLKEFIGKTQLSIYNKVDNNNLYLDITDCSQFTEYMYCEFLMKAIDAKQVIITKRDTTSLIDTINDHGFSETMKNYIKGSKSNETGYRIIAEFNDGTISGLVVGDNFTKIRWDYAYTGDYQTFTAPYDGYYKIELWGAQGGEYNTTYYGGKGGYTSGEINLKKGEKLYVYVGGSGYCGLGEGPLVKGGYNGGGDANIDAGTWTGRNFCSGGGATDVRLVSGTWDNFDSLKSRIMVAGAGGGANMLPSNYCALGGHSGGLSGYRSSGICYSTNGNYSLPGTQTTGYAFGKGQQYNTTTNGGGSGYFGGYSLMWSGGAGGSSYISGHNGSVAILESSEANNIIQRTGLNGSTCTDGTTDITCSYHYSEYIFKNTKMIDGEGYYWTTGNFGYVGQPQPDYTISTGHQGNGYARITFIESETTPSFRGTVIAAKEGETHKGIVYLDPTNLRNECNEALANANVNSYGALTGVNTGCMRFYIFDDSGENYTMILDHNTTGAIPWNSSNSNASMNEVATQLATDTEGWVGNPRLIDANEVAHIVGTDSNDTLKWDKTKEYGENIETQSSWFYFDGGRNTNITSYSSTDGWKKQYANNDIPSNYGWLFDNFHNSKVFGGNVNDDNRYPYGDGTKSEYIYGYWTSSPRNNSTSYVWHTFYNGHLGFNNANFSDIIGVRPVIEIPKTTIRQ